MKDPNNTSYSLKAFHRGNIKTVLITKNEKIFLPDVLLRRTVEWYHNQLCHPGVNRTEETIRQHFTGKNLRQVVEETTKKCHICQTTKRSTINYGHLPEKQAETDPWKTVCVDTIGPYTIDRQNGPPLKVAFLTMMDPATSWMEIKPLNNASSAEAAEQLELAWLSRYPWPEKLICDRGSEFKQKFLQMIERDYGIDRHAISTRNPQGNSMIERIHQTIGNMIRTLEPQFLTEPDPVPQIISAVRFAVISTYHTTLKATPMQLVFGRDAILNTKFQANWNYIKNSKQKLIQKNNERENAKRKNYQYAIGQMVLVKDEQRRKFGQNAYIGPYAIENVNDNGTVRIRKGNVSDIINIRQIKPYSS